MLIRLLAILIIIVGIAGLILPVIPGILMIALGILLFYRDRHEEISRIVNEKASGPFAEIYNKYFHKLILPRHYIGVDWDWVRKELINRERITPGGDERQETIRLAVDESIRKARSLTAPKYFYTQKEITHLTDDSIEIEGGVKFLTRKIPEYIKGANAIIILLVTIGDGVEKESSSLMSAEDHLHGYLLDRIGSFAVESLAENLEKRLRKDYALVKKSVSSRFSPGYCDWPVEEQFKMIKALDFSKIGVSLTEGCMMVPKKSISAIMAVGDEGVFKELFSSCSICEKKDCDYRRP